MKKKELRLKRDRIVHQLLEYITDPNNFTKSIRQCSDELGLDYEHVKQAIRKYGYKDFYDQMIGIKTNLLKEATGIAIGELYKRLLKPKNDKEFFLVQANIRDWYKVLVGTIERIEARFGGTVEHKYVIEFLKEARERVREVEEIGKEQEE